MVIINTKILTVLIITRSAVAGFRFEPSCLNLGSQVIQTEGPIHVGLGFRVNPMSGSCKIYVHIYIYGSNGDV